MANKLESGFVKADARNLPRVDMFMILDFIKKSDNFNCGEVHNVKLAALSRTSYGDQAIGYVCLKGDGQICTIKAGVCPQHRVREKGYAVSLTLDEDEDKIVDVQCYDCAATNGDCKRAMAFLMWIHRRSEQPSVTEQECYWKKSVLAGVGTVKKSIKVKEFG